MTPMTDILKRDITGECEGECRDLVRDGEEERQNEILASDVETPEEYPNAKWAKSRDEQPGVWGGHV
jgi:c-di-GMP-related signal transduction protein